MRSSRHIYSLFLFVCLQVTSFPPLRPACAQLGFYHIVGIDSATKVYLDDEELLEDAGQFPSGNYTLRVEKTGYHTFSKRIEINRDEVKEIQIQSLQTRFQVQPYRERETVQLRPMTGTIVVTSVPPGHAVLLNEVLVRGATPLVLSNVIVGLHKIQVGEVSGTFVLHMFEELRLRMEDGEMKDVSAEALPPELREVALEDIALFMEEDDELATNCANFQQGFGDNVFRLDQAESFLVARMKFHVPKGNAVSFPARFRIYRDAKLLHESAHSLEIDPRKQFRVCYFHYEKWRPGEYYLIIDTVAGSRLEEVNFTLLPE